MGTISTKANLDQMKRLRALTKGVDVGDKISDITKKYYNGTNGATYKNGLDGYVDNWSDYMKNQRKYLDQADKKLERMKTFEQFSMTESMDFEKQAKFVEEYFNDFGIKLTDKFSIEGFAYTMEISKEAAVVSLQNLEDDEMMQKIANGDFPEYLEEHHYNDSYSDIVNQYPELG